jgi:hypothetical protein
MQPSESLTGDGLVFVVGRSFIVFEPMLDLELCRRTSEHKVGHPVIVDGIERTALIQRKYLRL